MRVLLVNDFPPRAGSGVEVQLTRLIAGLRAAGDDVEVFTAALRRGLGKGFDVWDPASRRGLRVAAEAFVPDVIHMHNVIRELSPSVFGAVPSVASVLTVHDFRLLSVPDGPIDDPFDPLPLRWVKMRLAGVARALARRYVDEVIAPSVSLAERLTTAGFRRVHHVPHFADVGPEPDRPPSSSTEVVFAGRLSPEKGVFDLLDAFVDVSSRHPAARLILAGDGKERAALERRAANGAPGRVTFLGTVGEIDVARLMRTARMVVAPSTWREAAGLSVLEAALAGRPVVVSDDPALREIPDTAGSGIVVARGDVRALAAAMERLLADPVAADRMGEAARALVVRDRSVEAGIARTKRVYEAAIARAAARSRAR